MVCNVTELNTPARRYQMHRARDENVLCRPQRERGMAICDYMREINQKTDQRTAYGYGVSPAGTGKTAWLRHDYWHEYLAQRKICSGR